MHQEGKHTTRPASDAGSAGAPPQRVASIRSQLFIAGLLALLGFALVTQVRLAQADNLSNLRQEDLVRLLDEVTQRNEQLATERSDLLIARDELLSGEDSRRVAEEAAAERAVVQGILAGTVPVEGPGITLTLRDPEDSLRALTLFNVLQELRNAGAEAIEVSGIRLTASSWFTDASQGVIVDGERVVPPYEWTAIGDPQTLSVALDIPGGALAAVRNAGGSAQVDQHDLVQITAVSAAPEPQFATPVQTASPTP